MSGRRYSGPALDGRDQYITERPVQPGSTNGETVAATDDPGGEVVTENVPTPAEAVEGPDEPGQSTLDDWGWSA